MGKLLLVQISRGKYSSLLFLEVGLRRAPLIDQTASHSNSSIDSSHGRLFWLLASQGTPMKGPDNNFCILNVEMEAERSLQLKYHPTLSFPRLEWVRVVGVLWDCRITTPQDLTRTPRACFVSEHAISTKHSASGCFCSRNPHGKTRSPLFEYFIERRSPT